MEAVQWFRRAAEQGNAAALYMLGACYYNGEGTSEDKTEGIKWLRKAADEGQEDAIDFLREISSVPTFYAKIFLTF